MSNLSPQPIQKRCFNFAVSIVNYGMELKTEKQYEIASQVIRSGTSIGANMREATNSYSKADFLHKLSIAQKETDETIFWLQLMLEIRDTPIESKLIDEAEQILRILKTISMNTKRNVEMKKS